MNSIDRSVLLTEWLDRIFDRQGYRIVPLAGDCSFRQYFRVFVEGRQGGQYVVMDAPPPETIGSFIEIATLLDSVGVSVPKILERHDALGFLLLTDFGDRLYLRELTASSADHLYQSAFSALIKIHACDAPLPVFDQPFMHQQLSTLFQEWYLKKHLEIEQVEEMLQTIDPVLKHMIQVIDSQPKVLMHRDYHSRNLMILEESTPGVLDFQDAMRGPITYDLVSLLQDCYISWPRVQVTQWVLDFQRMAVDAGLLIPDISSETFIKWFDWTGLQRHLKNLGIFSRMHHRNGKSAYLKDIPMVLKYISETCRRYSELMPLWLFFKETLQVTA